ncbi:membrane protein [Arthrobacter stackebrandtii]|uniref:Membrane protein n=1 Tax=Arthrobacter stackebrandtii TaxID=272161 RepID=A0ABS4YSB0_9MICC|nr:YihY/virulence factor BrkB family protein [Arthrobacter stackebrandtii]MBP2411677.1 membrane protein [Arthrobacter stackebrandtii]
MGDREDKALAAQFPGFSAPGVAAKKPMAASPAPPPSPLDRKSLAAWTGTKRGDFITARREGSRWQQLKTLFPWLNAWAGQLFPLRVWQIYSRRRGPLLAAGNAYLMFFSVGAMLVAGFAILGLFASGNEVLRDAVVDLVADSTPGLIDTGDGGLVKPEQLLGTRGFGTTLLVSLAALLVTAMGWINGLREGIRSILGLARDRTNPVLSKVRDLLTLLVLGVALILTSVLGLLSSAIMDGVGQLLGLDGLFSGATTKLASLGLMFVLDVAVAVIMFSIAARVHMPRRVLVVAALISGAGATVLRFFSAMLLNGVTSNPLLAPFAVILGLFVWFFLLSQVYLISAAVAAILAADRRARTKA